MNTTHIKNIHKEFYISASGYLYCNPDLSTRFNNKTGMFEISGDTKHISHLDTNLSYHTDYYKLSQFVFGCKSNTELGHVYKTLLAQSSNESRKYKASSGGVIKEVLHYLFEIKQIDAVIAVQKTGKMRYEPVKLTDPSQIDALPPSIYHITDYSRMIPLIEDAKESKIAFVGTPWQIDDLYLYVSQKPVLRKKIQITIGLLTGWYFTWHSIKALCTYYNIDYKRLDDIRYRGNGRIGKIRFFMDDGTEKAVPRFNFISKAASERYYSVPFFLQYTNMHNMLADIVVGDSHTPETAFSKTGISLVIARRKEAYELLANLQKKERIVMCETDNNHLIRSQKRERLYGDFAVSYNKFLRNEYGFAPFSTGINTTHARPYNTSVIRRFHLKLLKRQQLQREGKYQLLLFIKAKEEFIDTFFRLISGKLFFKYLNKIRNKKKKNQKPTGKLAIFD